MSRDIPWRIIKDITDDFSEERRIGRGGYGAVYKGVHEDGHVVAVKKLYHMPGLDEMQFQSEIKNLEGLHHPNIVQLVGKSYEEQDRCVEYNGKLVFATMIDRAICLEYVPNGSLEKHLYDDMLPKIADFGLSRIFSGTRQSHTTNKFVGTIGYVPPEYIEKGKISEKFDVFSLGVIIIKLVTGPDVYGTHFDLSSEEFIELTHENWRKRLEKDGLKDTSYLNALCQVKTCIEIAMNCVQTGRHKRPSILDIIRILNGTETTLGEMYKQLFDVQPQSLCFPFEPDKLIPCPLQITNKAPGATAGPRKRGAENELLKGAESSSCENSSETSQSGPEDTFPSEMSAVPVAVAGRGSARRLCVKERDGKWWDRVSSPECPEEEFRRAFRMSRATFETLCEELGAAVYKEGNMLRSAIPVRQRVAVCIWRLATGEPLGLIAKRFGLGISTCRKLVLQVCAAIEDVLQHKAVRWPETQEDAATVAARFQAVSGIPNVVGAMYTTHIPIIAPKANVAAYLNRRHTERNKKTTYSITVQGVVNTAGAFTDLFVGWPGSMSDAEVLERSALCAQRGAAGLLQGQWVVGGAGYPLMDWLLVPYTDQNVTWAQHVFNDKVAGVRAVARDAFQRLKARWRCLQRRTEFKVQDLPVMLRACCVLHNICERAGDAVDNDIPFAIFDDDMVAENPVRSPAAAGARDAISHNLLHHY
ncbi:hypothetical protein ACP4OV_015183 [Aristida adscensionis]